LKVLGELMAETKIVSVNLTGKDLVSGKVFETTSESVAKYAGIYRDGSAYKPATIIAGAGDLLKALDEEIAKMKVGEKKTLKLPPEKAFGERKKELVVVVPLREFDKRKIRPFPGLIVDVNNQYGKVQTVSGGRVRVDFNSDLAGKDVEYEIEIEKEFKTDKEKVGALVEKFFPFAGDQKPDFELKSGNLEVKIPKIESKEIEMIKQVFEKTIKDFVKGVKEVKISEKAEKKEKKAEKKK